MHTVTAGYCDVRVCLYICLSVCLSVYLYISGATHPNFRELSLYIAHGRDLVLLWRCCILHSGFVNDITFLHNDQEYAMRKGCILKVIHQGASPTRGAESVDYDFTVSTLYATPRGQRVARQLTTSRICSESHQKFKQEISK